MNGSFDEVLTKPCNPIVYICLQNLNPDYIAHFILGGIMLGIGFSNLGIHLSFLQILQLFGVFIVGGLVYGGLFLICIGAFFLFTKAHAFRQVMFQFRELSYYPISIFPRVIQAIMTVILPYAMIGFFPVQSLLGKSDYLMFDHRIVLLAPIIAIAFFVIGVVFASECIKRYKSTGS
jgi:ABC-2 type transport system permease protein